MIDDATAIFDLIELPDFQSFSAGSGSGSSGGSGGSGADDAKTLGEQLKDIEGLIDKEYEAMLVFDEINLKATGRTAYFDKMRDVLEQEVAYYQKVLETSSDYDEKIDAQNNLIEAQKKLNNLDDEEVED